MELLAKLPPGGLLCFPKILFLGQNAGEMKMESYVFNIKDYFQQMNKLLNLSKSTTTSLSVCHVFSELRSRENNHLSGLSSYIVVYPGSNFLPSPSPFVPIRPHPSHGSYVHEVGVSSQRSIPY